MPDAHELSTQPSYQTGSLSLWLRGQWGACHYHNLVGRARFERALSQRALQIRAQVEASVRETVILCEKDPR